ncbi:M23 family metallopeptidase [Sedimentitalea todarodis]|uniref:M23 family metallopeptidase n=1 Tax=Sedimentitalea todarodis TaxID=1631240 RepID=A0ABU3V8A4_9RHOB|nr:M23 family metallopeptidase [Sedimentitalea todarodis]MDU9002338.1 M23 family metallopeptidase [Sedimentitalea todarodis]
MRAALAAVFLSPAASVAASDFRLDLPIDCVPGETCYIQRYVDHDPGPGVRDFRCGALSGDDHKGTDFALHTLADMRRGVEVRAAAPGEVVGMRDGMPDRLYTPTHAAEIDGLECGNGVVLRHDTGWETQYCHLKSGSVRVETGDQVVAGGVLGQVGLSGLTNFPHVHLSVRKDGTEIDPFRPEAGAGCAAPTVSLWRETPEYTPGGLIYAGFADHVPDLDAIADGTAAMPDIGPDADALVLFAFAYAGQVDDIIMLSIEGPDETVIKTDMTLDKAQVRFFRAAGKRLTRPEWPSGSYRGTAILLRNDEELDRRIVHLVLP